MMWYSKVIVLLSVLLEWSSGYTLYPGIFDPNPFIPKVSPEVLKVTRHYRLPLGYKSAGGDNDGEVGYVRSHSEKGTGGFHHSESFHKKDGNDYDHEKQYAFGESKDDEVNQLEKQEESVRKNDVEDDQDEDIRSYEVNEEQDDDHSNPDQHTTYGVAPVKPKKIPQSLVPEYGTRLTLPKRTSHKKHHNGYETVIYHGNENESSEKGYDRRQSHNAPPKVEVVNQKEEESSEEQEGDEQEEDARDSNDNNDQEPERSDYGDNYNSFRYGNEFSKNYDGKEEHQDDDGGAGRNERGKSNRNDSDYDEEVDREESDAAANEDRYQGDEYEDYGKDHRRQYEYASEADYDAQ